MMKYIARSNRVSEETDRVIGDDVWEMEIEMPGRESVGVV